MKVRGSRLPANQLPAKSSGLRRFGGLCLLPGAGIGVEGFAGDRGKALSLLLLFGVSGWMLEGRLQDDCRKTRC